MSTATYGPATGTPAFLRRAGEADSPGTAIEPGALRRAFGHFATGVTIVTTRDAGGAPVGVTASSFNTVSLAPPLVLWSVARNAYSFSAFAQADHFAVHVLAAGQRDLSDRFARPATDKFGGLALGQGHGGVPLLPGAPVVFECAAEHRYEGGDHLILVGRVLRITESDAADAPLLFHRGRYAGLAQAAG